MPAVATAARSPPRCPLGVTRLSSGGVGAHAACPWVPTEVLYLLRVDALTVHPSVPPASRGARDTLHAGHVLLLHSGRESSAAKSHHGQDPGHEEGLAACREDTHYPSGLLGAGCTKSCWQDQGSHFAVTGVTQSPCFGLVAFPFL